MATSNYTPEQENDYKLIISYVKDFFRYKKLILGLILIFCAIGVLKILFSPDVYSSNITFITQNVNSNKGGGLGGIAQLIGGASQANNSTSDIPSFLYPQIIESLPYQRKLYKTPIQLKKLDSLIPYSEYALNYEPLTFKQKLLKYTIGLPKVLFGDDEEISSLSINKKDSLEYEDSVEQRVISSLRKKVILNIDEEYGTLEVKAQMVDEPVAAAQLAMSATDILQQEIIRYRIASAQQKYDFIQEQFQIRKKNYERVQVEYASYSDRNPFNMTKSSLIKKSRLENEINLLFGIRSDLEQQLMSQGIKIQEDTPTFTIIDPAVVPLKEDDKGVLITIIGFTLLGFILTVFFYILKISLSYIKSLWIAT